MTDTQAPSQLNMLQFFSAPNIIKAMFVLLGALQLLDLHSTLLALTAGHSETNLLILKLSHSIGIHFAVIFYKAIALGIIFLYFKFSQHVKTKRYVAIPLAILIAVYAAVVLNNYSI